MVEQLNVIGGCASVIALLITFGTIAYRLTARYRRLKADVERRLHDELDRYRNASGTVGARTDLGFFLLNTLSQHRANALYNAIISLASVVLAMMLASLSGLCLCHYEHTHSLRALQITYLYVFGALVFLIFGVFMGFITIRYVRLENSFDAHFRKLWGAPITKHIDRQLRQQGEGREDLPRPRQELENR